MLFSRFRYASLPDIDVAGREIKTSEPTTPSDCLEPQSLSQSTYRIILYWTCCLLLGTTLVILFVWDITKSSTRAAQSLPLTASWLGLNCSNTVSGAKALGCQFDLLSYSWTPAECMDRQTAVEFNEWVLSEDRHFGAWPFFADKDAEQRIPDEETLSRRLGVQTRTSQEEHLGHCKIGRA